MLAARASTAHRLTHALKGGRRTFASVVDTSGLKVASIDHGQPTSAVTFLVKAGSRFETKPGVANALKNFAFKSTEKRSALGTVRETELYGGVLSASLTREHLALTAEFLKGDEAYFVDLLTSFITSAKFTRHEFEEYVLPVIESETTSASSDPATRAVELAHAVAFRSGLGASLFASPHSPITVTDIKEYAASAFSKGNVAVLGTGISQEALSKLVEKSLGQSISSGSAPSATSSTYHGGEMRLESHEGKQTIFVGFGTTGTPAPELAALAAHLNSTPSVKWSQGTSPLSADLPKGTSVDTVFLPYSDATLFGLLIQGPTAEAVKTASQNAVKHLKVATSASGVNGDDLKKAIAKAKFTAASSVDQREGLVAALGSKILAGSDASLDSTLSSLDKVNATAFSKAASSLIKTKPTFVAVGDIRALPYADELGL